MTSIPASLTDLKVQVAMNMTLGMVLDDSNLDSSGLMGTSALLGDEGSRFKLYSLLFFASLCLPLFFFSHILLYAFIHHFNQFLYDDIVESLIVATIARLE